MKNGQLLGRFKPNPCLHKDNWGDVNAPNTAIVFGHHGPG